MRRKFDRVAVFSVAAALCISTITSAPATATDLAETEPATVTESTFSGTPDSSSRTTAKKTCEFVQRVDSAHISTKSKPRIAVQSHGNWGNVNCAYTSAVVETWVLKRNVVGIYVKVGSPGKKTMRPSASLGSANRVTAHYGCKNQTEHTFKSWTDVDVIGIADLPNRQYSLPRPLRCN
jgi:hypothetical protein